MPIPILAPVVRLDADAAFEVGSVGELIEFSIGDEDALVEIVVDADVGVDVEGADVVVKRAEGVEDPEDPEGVEEPEDVVDMEELVVLEVWDTVVVVVVRGTEVVVVVVVVGGTEEEEEELLDGMAAGSTRNP